MIKIMERINLAKKQVKKKIRKQNVMKDVVGNLLLWRSVTRLMSHQPPHAGYYNAGYLTSQLEGFLLELRNKGYGEMIDKSQKEASIEEFQEKVLHLDSTPEEMLEKVINQQTEAFEKVFKKRGKKSKEEEETEMKYVG